RVADALNERTRALRGARVLVLGVAYKAGVSDVRASPALEIIEGLLAKGAVVEYHDPFVPSVTVGTHVHQAVDWASAALASRDVVMILTDHATYDWAAIVRESPLVIDTRNATGSLPPARHVIRL